MKVLITGSSGSFGSIISRSLVSNGITVAGIDINEPIEHLSDQYFRFYKCSITDKESLKSIFTEEKPTHVIHLACTFNKVRNQRREHDIDIGGSRNIIEIADQTPSVKQLIFSSSATAYGGNRDNPLWIKEEYPLNPGAYRYGSNKMLIEGIYSETPVRKDLNVVLVRICIVVGPGFIKRGSTVAILKRWKILPGFFMENKVQFLHTDDFISLINLIINDEQIEGIFNVAPDTYSVVRDIVNNRMYIRVPVWLVKGLAFILWNLRIRNFDPAAISVTIYPVVLDPGKIISRFNYKFRFNSSEAYADADIDVDLPRR